MTELGKYRKFIVAALGALAVIGAEIPPDAPGWLTGTLATITAVLVYLVRNDVPVARVEPKHDEAAGYPGTRVGGYESGSRPPSEFPPPGTRAATPEERMRRRPLDGP